jgi:hypothetical protein
VPRPRLRDHLLKRSLEASRAALVPSSRRNAEKFQRSRPLMELDLS